MTEQSYPLRDRSAWPEDASTLDALLVPGAVHFVGLSHEERRDWLVQILRSWDDQDAVALVAEAAVLALRAGAPPPTLLSVFEEADEWAALAAPGERAAYAWHAGRRLTPQRRAGLIRALARQSDEVAG